MITIILIICCWLYLAMISWNGSHMAFKNIWWYRVSPGMLVSHLLERILCCSVTVKVLRYRYVLLFRYEVTNKCIEVAVQFIDTFQMLPQHVSASHCHYQGGAVPQTLHKQYLCCGCIWITICPVWPVVEGCHTGQTVIRIHPQHKYWLSNFWGTTTPFPDDGIELLKHGVKSGMYQ
jgi:hypothetical protein